MNLNFVILISAKKLLGIQYIRKTIIVDSKMNIIESNANLFSDNLEKIIN